MHPVQIWEDGKESPRELLYAALMLAPIFLLQAYVMVKGEEALRVGVRLAGGPEVFAETVVFGMIAYVMVYFFLGEYLFEKNGGDDE